MLVLAVILIIVGAGVVVAAVAGASDQPASFDLGVFSVEMDTRGVFLSGAATVLLLGIGLLLLRSGARRANRRRKDKKELNRLAQELQARERRTETARSGDEPAEATPSNTGGAASADPGATRVEERDTTEEAAPQPPADPDATEPGRPST